MILNWFNGSNGPFGTFFISWGWLRTVVLEVFMLEVIQATFSRQCSLINQKETVTYLFYESITRNRKRSVPSSAKWVISAGGWKPPLTHMTHIILRWVVKHWQQRQQQGRKRQLRHCNGNALTGKTIKIEQQSSHVDASLHCSTWLTKSSSSSDSQLWAPPGIHW